jgi:hypothetical protein
MTRLARKFSSLGTRIKSLGWVPFQDSAPSFSDYPFLLKQSHRPRSGSGTGEPPSSYGAVDRSINSGVPFWEGCGAVWVAGQWRDECAKTVAHGLSSLPRGLKSRLGDKLLITSRVQDRGLWPGVLLRRQLR